MKQIKIAVPTDDRRLIAPKTGRCKEFAVYSVNNLVVESVEYRKNAHHDHDHDHNHGEETEHSHNEIMELLSDCNYMLMKHIGKYMRSDLQAAGIGFSKSELDEIDAAVPYFVRSTKLAQIIVETKHPAIDLSLSELGILQDVDIEGNVLEATFVFPFPNIPIADQLMDSIEKPARELGFEMRKQTRIMNSDERNYFLQLEKKAWKGL